MGSKHTDDPTPSSVPDHSVIPSIADLAANNANMAAIDRLVATRTYHHIVAWGKWLGFTPDTVRNLVQEAEADGAPANAIQKIDGKWLTSGDIQNEGNRSK